MDWARFTFWVLFCPHVGYTDLLRGDFGLNIYKSFGANFDNIV